MEGSSLIKTDNYYYYYNNNKLYSLRLSSNEMLRIASNYSFKKWNEYVYRMITNLNSIVIKDEVLILKFKQKAIEIDINPSKILILS